MNVSEHFHALMLKYQFALSQRNTERLICEFRIVINGAVDVSVFITNGVLLIVAECDNKLYDFRILYRNFNMITADNLSMLDNKYKLGKITFVADIVRDVDTPREILLRSSTNTLINDIYEKITKFTNKRMLHTRNTIQNVTPDFNPH